MKYAGFIINALLFGLMSCLNMSISADKDNSANFSSYKTFAWLPHKKDINHKNSRLDNDIVEKNIFRYVNQELLIRGLHVDTVNPDILLDYDIMTEKKFTYSQEPVYRPNMMYGYYGGWGYGAYRPYNYNPGYWGYSMNYQTVKIPYQDGTVTIDIIDRNTEKVVWKSWAEGSVDDVYSFEHELPKDIKRMFKKYPVLPLKPSK